MKAPPDFGVADADLVEVVIRNDLQHAKQVEDRIIGELARCAYSPEVIFAVKLSIEEAITNAVKHGNRNDPATRISVRYYVDDQRVVIVVRDEGRGFSPRAVPDPTADENLERPNGRGLMLMQSYMTKIRYNRTGNEVWLLKEARDQGPSPPLRTPRP